MSDIPSGIDGVPDIEVEVVASGNGPKPTRGQRVTTHYVGTYPDGASFDSSRERGSPFAFQVGVGQVIRGWDLILGSMSVGDRWKCTIPYQLAYGEQGHPGGIPPKATLVFDMELLGIDG